MCLNTRKIISVLLSGAMMLSTSSFSVFAEETETVTEVIETVEQTETEIEETTVLPETEETVETPEIQSMSSDVSLVSATSLSGVGTEESPYLIYTEDELVALATGTIDNALSAYYELQNDITLSSETWTPIGAEAAFTGYFDGCGFTITGGELFQSTGISGLFGINSGTIENLKVIANIDNTATNAGLLAGTNNGTIDNCSSYGEINTESNVSIGGLVGYNTGTIKNSSSCAVVTSTNGHSGGLVGTNDGGTIELSRATGDVTSTSGNAGGLVGQLYTYPDRNTTSTAAVRYSYATGTVTGRIAGGLVGNSYSCAAGSSSKAYNVIEYSYAHGSVTGNSYAGGLVGYSESRKASGTDYLNTIKYCYAVGVVNEGNGAGLLGGYNSIYKNIVRYSYYNSKNEGNQIGYYATESRLKTESIYYGWDFVNIWKVDDASIYPYINLTGSEKYIDISGGGTSTNPYKIENEEQLFALSAGYLPKSLYYELANDITVNAIHWTPIGDNGEGPFNGVFDGKGHTISGLTLENSHYEYIGLFGNNSGTIKNLNVDVNFVGVKYAGGIAAYNSGTIENCTVTGTINGTGDSFGGLVGYNTGTIKNSSSSAVVTSTNGHSGGLVGTNDGGTIELSCATGDVTSTNGNAGGLVGQLYTYPDRNTTSTATVRYSYATGTVTGAIAGGLVGNSYSCAAGSSSKAYNVIEYSYAHGNVTGTSNAGGLVGYSESRKASGTDYLNTIKYCYAVGVVNEGNGAGLLGGYNGIYRNIVRYSYYNSKNDGNKIGYSSTASKLKTKDIYYGWNFDNIWSLENSTFPYIKLNGSYTGVSVEGFGDDNDPYIIENEEQLIAMLNGEIGPSSKAYYELANDITVTASHWTPIGDNGENSFNGVFDGKGHTISGVTLKNSHYEYIGLFGNNSGTVKNLNVDVNFVGVKYAGGIAAYNSGTIENCSVTGTINGTGDSFGGLVGYNTGTIKNSSSSAVVTSTNGHSGGLVGINDSGTIELSYATGNVTSTSGNAGGLVGQLYTYASSSTTSTATVRYSYATGTVMGTIAGGLVGNSYSCAAGSSSKAYNVIEYSYAHGNVTGNSYAGGLVGYSESRKTSGIDYLNTIQYCYAVGVVNEGNGAGLLGGYNSIYKNIVRYSYYNSQNIGNSIGFSTTTDMLTVKDTYYGWNFDNIWSLRNKTYPYIELNGTYYGVDIEGAGDDDDPYIIENEEQLIAMLNGEIGPSSKAYYELANDITVTASHWTPIGDNGENSFNGVFDGKGHTISGLTLENSHYEYIGLFGNNSGTVKNLNVDVNFVGAKYAGGIAAYNSGTVENCSVTGTINGTGDSFGGLVGYNTGTIKNSSSSAVVTSTNGHSGGLVGTNDGGTIELSRATGNVTSTSGNAGGLVGQLYTYPDRNTTSTAAVRYSYATGTVTGRIAGGLVGNSYSCAAGSSSKAYNVIEYSYAHGNVTGTSNAGGLVGYSESRKASGTDYLNTIQYCYAIGVVNGETHGGLVGYISGRNTVLSAYYNTDKSGCSDIDKGTPLSDESMKTNTSYVGWDFNTVWAMSSGICEGYPYLKSMIPVEAVAVTGVKLNKSTLSLIEGNSETLTATITPTNATNNGVSWTSSDTSVAIVLNGRVAAKAPGTATITVSTADGGYTASCTVTVTPVDTTIDTTGITLNKSAVSLEEGKTETLTAAVSPSDATNKAVTWTSSDASVAAVSNGTVTALKAGTATITATTADGGYTASCIVTVTERVTDENAPTIKISDIKAKPGKEVQVTIDLANNTGFTDMGIEVGYNSDIMTLTNAVSNSGVGCTFTKAQYYTVNPYNMGWTGTSNVNYNGNIATLTFTVNENAADGVYPITVDYYKGVNGNYVDGVNINYDENFDAVGFVYVSGNVVVASYVPGDVNGDEFVDNKDATYLLRYLAGWNLTGIVTDALDVDGSTVVDNRDATILLRYLAGWDVTLH